MTRKFVIAAVLSLLAVPALAQQPLKLEIKDGRVNLDVSAVPARQILTEWARVGGTKIVGGDKMTGTPLTLKFVNMPERQALDIILRSVAGYMAAPRLASATPGASAYDRIVILPTSAGAASAAANTPRTSMPANPGMLSGNGRVPPRPPGMMPRPGEQVEAIEQDDPPEPDDPADTGVMTPPPVFTFPQPQTPGNQVFVPVPQNMGQQGMPGGTAPMIQLQPNANGQPTIYNFTPTNTAAPGAAGGGFQVIGSPTPGVVQQPVAQPGQPVQPKPPGGRQN